MALKKAALLAFTVLSEFQLTDNGKRSRSHQDSLAKSISFVIRTEREQGHSGGSVSILYIRQIRLHCELVKVAPDSNDCSVVVYMERADMQRVLPTSKWVIPAFSPGHPRLHGPVLQS